AAHRRGRRGGDARAQRAAGTPGRARRGGARASSRGDEGGAERARRPIVAGGPSSVRRPGRGVLDLTQGRHRMTVGKKIAAGFGLALTMLVLVGVVSYRNTVELIDTSQWVAHTHTVLERLETVRALLQDVENGARGYVITGKEEF